VHLRWFGGVKGAHSNTNCPHFPCAFKMQDAIASVSLRQGFQGWMSGAWRIGACVPN